MIIDPFVDRSSPSPPQQADSAQFTPARSVSDSSVLSSNLHRSRPAVTPFPEQVIMPETVILNQL